MYTAIHWWTLAVVGTVMAAICAAAFCFRGNEKAERRILNSVAVFQLGFEVLWRLIYVLVKGDSVLCWWPMYPCNLGGILIPVAALINSRRMKQMFYLFGFVGGCLTFALPEGIFCTDVMVFPVLKSILQHTGLLLIPALEWISGNYRASLRDYGWVVLGCVIHTVNCEVIDRVLGFTGDYMFFRSGMPFVIPGVPQPITLSVFALAVLSVLAWISSPADLPFRKKAIA